MKSDNFLAVPLPTSLFSPKRHPGLVGAVDVSKGAKEEVAAGHREPFPQLLIHREDVCLGVGEGCRSNDSST